jgi:hypothetical protein
MASLQFGHLPPPHNFEVNSKVRWYEAHKMPERAQQARVSRRFLLRVRLRKVQTLILIPFLRCGNALLHSRSAKLHQCTGGEGRMTGASLQGTSLLFIWRSCKPILSLIRRRSIRLLCIRAANMRNGGYLLRSQSRRVNITIATIFATTLILHICI